MNSINALNLVNISLRHFEEAISNFSRFGGKVFWDFMLSSEHYARKWTYELLENEEKEAAIQLFKELEARASELFFADTHMARKGKRTTVFDHYGPIVSVKDEHNFVIKAAMEYGRRWREFV